MATHSQTRPDMTLEEFLRWPRIDDKPYLEYLGGRIEVKVSPQQKHSLIEFRLASALNRFAEPSGLGFAFPEQRCTFAGRSIVPDIVFLLEAKIRRDVDGNVADETFLTPDIHIEIRSPGQAVKKTKDKLGHSMANGCPLGWYIDPYQGLILVYRPGQPEERLPANGFLDASPVLPGFLLPVSEVFGWMKLPKPGPGRPEVGPR